MTRKEFVKELKNEATMSGSINISLTDAEYNRVTDRELKGIYQMNPMAVQKQYVILSKQIFYSPEFRKNRTIQFPDCVLSIGKFEEMRRRNAMFGLTNDFDFGYNKLFIGDMISMNSFLNVDALTMRTITMSLIDQLQTYVLIDIQHSWNEAQHRLLITGHDPRYDVYVETYTKVPETNLFDDYYVRKWIFGAIKLQIAKQIGTFTTTLIGGVTVNASLYTEEGKADQEEAKTYWKTMIDSDMFFLTTP